MNESGRATVEPDAVDLVAEVGHAVAGAVSGGGDAPGRWVELLGRVGLVAYGALHAVIAALIVRSVLGAREEIDIDQDGAVALVAGTGVAGTVVLGVSAAGLMAFGTWQICAAAGGFRWVTGSERMRKRVGAAAKAIAVLTVAVIAVPVALGEPPDRSSGGARAVTATLLDLPAGRFVVGLVAAVALVMAGSMVYTGARATFMGDLRRARLSRTLQRIAVVCGSAGNFARAAAFTGVGLSFGAAALTDDPSRSAGVNGVLHSLTRTSWGLVGLLTICVGIAAFGVYCVIDAYARRA